MRERRAPEKKVEKAGDELMALFGFTAIRFSQARATMQTRGISDRLYIHERAKLAVWWEAKSKNGRQSVSQVWFQGLIQSVALVVRWTYLCGGVEVLEQYLCDIGLARRASGAGLEGVRHSA